MGFENTLAKVGVLAAGAVALNFGVNYFFKIDLLTQAINAVSTPLGGFGGYVVIGVMGLAAYGGIRVLAANV